MAIVQNGSASIEVSPDQQELFCLGDWTVSHLSPLEDQLPLYADQLSEKVIIHADNITKMDSAGALLFYTLINHLKSLGKAIEIIGLSQNIQSLLKLIANESKFLCQPLPSPKMPGAVYLLGEWAMTKWRLLIDFLTFVGEVAMTASQGILKPQRIQWRAILRAIEETGYQALPIVALLSFLVGVVLTYQIALQLDSYNADIFVVDIAGTAILREFSPLITAIIAAGRTSAAFTAQIGTMKVNEEIDALNTMGVVPIEYLVLPKLIALMISLTLLTVWADIFGTFGSMIMAKSQLGIGYLGFLDRFHHAITVRHYIAGLIKGPVFGLIIAAVGCFHGFQVGASADSVGQKTTQSAVQSIFLIIIADAIFSVVFSLRGI
ncbi:MlaE family lipid ABC transporter permease subunit [Coxiella endosymbiont of Ornithodoros amblus]|uniref:ABC transporter permease n=1 Tax=Coxiella endosymbiont of Ornithodoros amblus TaxID=1656166 RepID=UPI00244E309E|nr:MlaE family lipid ABC transporter permease subunit [Coxiella endosymbiont of Ornithodoros amblus]MBW5803025.1 MlaE family lipid ABC transporter permease subunit [Coxiella endosymbiont of Ornithodoros amblus]